MPQCNGDSQDISLIRTRLNSYYPSTGYDFDGSKSNQSLLSVIDATYFRCDLRLLAQLLSQVLGDRRYTVHQSPSGSSHCAGQGAFRIR